MSTRLVTQYVFKPDPDARRATTAALRILAGVIAEKLLEEARLELMRETGVKVAPRTLLPSHSEVSWPMEFACLDVVNGEAGR